MKTYQEMTLAERQAEYAALCRTHQEQKALGLDLNMARGKPGREQLDMVMEMYNIPLTADDFITLALRDIRPDITPREIVELFR